MVVQHALLDRTGVLGCITWGKDVSCNIMLTDGSSEENALRRIDTLDEVD